MATVDFATIPCETSTANRRAESHIFLGKFIPVLITLCGRSVDVGAFLWVFMKNLRIFAC